MRVSSSSVPLAEVVEKVLLQTPERLERIYPFRAFSLTSQPRILVDE